MQIINSINVNQILDYLISFSHDGIETKINPYLESILILAVDLVRKMKTKMMMTPKK